MKNYTKERVFEVLALALDDNTPKHHIAYLLSKLNASFVGLDCENTQLLERIKEVDEE